MAKTTRTFMVCDNPRCSGTREHGESEPAVGIFIDSAMLHFTSGGGEAAKIYACSQRCAGPAIAAVFSEARGSDKLRTDW